MTSYGWSSDSTWGVAGACDNTASFQDTLQPIIHIAAGGMITAAADQLREAVAERKLLAETLPTWVDLSDVNWTELVTAWAEEAEEDVT